MIDPSHALRPIGDAGAAIDRLAEYRDPAELAEAVQATWAAVEASLRRLLRDDPEAPDEFRLAALSPADLPPARLIEALRQGDRISLPLAGMAHELERAARRAGAGEVRSADADLARDAVGRLVREVREIPASPPPAAVPPAAAPAAVDWEAAEPGTAPRTAAGGLRLFRLSSVVVALLALATLAVVVGRSLDDGMDEAIAAFRAGRPASAEPLFRRVLEDAPGDVTANLYLARIYRRGVDFERAAARLRIAAVADPDDPDVRRELGHLFMDLNRPQAAAGQYRRALEVEPGSVAAWIGLVNALRAAGDPSADEVLRRAPSEVRAALDRRE